LPRLSRLIYSTLPRAWRNWQTRRIEGPVPFFGSAGSTPVARNNARITARNAQETSGPFSFGQSVVLNIVSVVVIYAAMARMDARLTPIEQWMALERAVRQKIADDWPATQRRQKEFDAALSKARADLKGYNAAGGVTGEVTRDFKGEPGPSLTR
jgi:hypothetical protein